MKRIALATLAAVGFSLTGIAGAQTCAAPTTIASNGTFSGNTCAATGNETGVAVVCGNGNFTDKAAVFTWTKGDATSSHTGNLVVTPTVSYDVGLAVVRTTCGSTGVCVGLTDSAQDGTTAETIDLSAAGYGPAGTYYLFVTSFADGSNGATCGTFNGTVGTLPVKLQSMSVE